MVIPVLMAALPLVTIPFPFRPTQEVQQSFSPAITKLVASEAPQSSLVTTRKGIQ